MVDTTKLKVGDFVRVKWGHPLWDGIGTVKIINSTNSKNNIVVEYRRGYGYKYKGSFPPGTLTKLTDLEIIQARLLGDW